MTKLRERPCSPAMNSTPNQAPCSRLCLSGPAEWRLLMRNASALLVLNDTLESNKPEPGSHGLMIAMGPGFCSELVLIRFQG